MKTLLIDIKSDWRAFKENFDPRADEAVAMIFLVFAIICFAAVV